MQGHSEMKTKSLFVHEPVHGRTFRAEGNEVGNAPSFGSSRPRRHNRQKKKPSGKRKLNTVKRDYGNVDPSTMPVDQKAESGQSFHQSPLKGIKAIFQGGSHSRSKAEMRDLPVNQTYTRPATPGPSKNQDKTQGSFQPSPEHQNVKHQQSSRAFNVFSSPYIPKHDSTSGPNGLTQQALTAVSSEKLDPVRDSEGATSANRNQKKRRNRRKNKREKSKRDSSPVERAPGQCSPGQPDVQTARQNFPPWSSMSKTGLPQMTNRPPPIPVFKFEVKPEYGSEKVSGSIPNLGPDMVPKIDRSPRKDNAEKSLFPRAGGVVRILQNKSRGTDIGCTHTANQQSQKSIPQVLSAARQIHGTMTVETVHQDPRPPSFNGTGRIRAEVSNLRENKTTVAKQLRNECQGPSHVASLPPVRLSSQDVRNDDEATSRIRKTPRKPRGKPFQKYRGK